MISFSVVLIFAHADGSRGRGRVFTGVCLCVYPSAFARDMSKTAAATITKLDTEMFHSESMESHLFRGQKVKGQGHEAQKNSAGVGLALS